MIRRFLFLWSLLLPFLAGCAGTRVPVGPALEVGVEPDLGWARLVENDLVRVTVYGHPEASTRAEGERVDAAGVLGLPLLGPLEVRDLTVDQVRELVAREAARYIRDPKVGVTVLGWAARDFYLLGNVENPGPYPIDRPLTALQALSYGGQFASGARREEVYLLRRDGDLLRTHRFDATRPGPDGLVAVRPDDILFVARGKSGAFREEVLPYLQGLGFLSAVPLALASIVD